MFSIRKPTAQQIDNLLTSSNAAEFTYDGIGSTSAFPSPNLPGPFTGAESRLPSGYRVDHNWVKLGDGEAAYEWAKNALRQWQMFNLSWVQICWHSAMGQRLSIADGTMVGVLASRPFWSLNPCRIVYTVDESDEKGWRSGFGYGTLAGHLAKGEERFQVVWNRMDNSVCYEILAFSKPNHPLAILGYPIVRHFQRRFARDSKAAMAKSFSTVSDGRRDL